MKKNMYRGLSFFLLVFAVSNVCAAESTLVPVYHILLGTTLPGITVVKPVYKAGENQPELGGDFFGAMGEHPVRKISIANPFYAEGFVPYFSNHPEGLMDVPFTVDLFFPGDEVLKKRPTIFFISGWRIQYSDSWRSLLYFIASQGYNAVFISYNETDAALDDMIVSVVAEVVNHPLFYPMIDQTKVGFIGHSMGGSVLYDLAIQCSPKRNVPGRCDNLNLGMNGRFIFSLAAGRGYNLSDTTEKIDLPSGTKIIVQTYNEIANDPGFNTDPRVSIDLLVHSSVDIADKNYLYLPGDESHVSNHSTPKNDYENGVYTYDALDQIGVFRPLESLMRYSFGEAVGVEWKHIGLPPGSNWGETNGIRFFSGDDPYNDQEMDFPHRPPTAYEFRCDTRADDYNHKGLQNPRSPFCEQ
jgi:hypothetical protein